MNDLLSEWSESRAMPAARAEAIRGRIVAPYDAAPSLDYAWWQDLFVPLRRAVASGRHRPPVIPGRPLL